MSDLFKDLQKITYHLVPSIILNEITVQLLAACTCYSHIFFFHKFIIVKCSLLLLCIAGETAVQGVSGGKDTFAPEECTKFSQGVCISNMGSQAKYKWFLCNRL